MTRYVIGIGSQRCGTTLLHALLDTARGLAMHPVKELHYFDVKCGLRPLALQQSRARRRLLRQVLRPHTLFTGPRMLAARTNWLLANSPAVDYPYETLFGDLAVGNHAVGEVTPEYMLLPASDVRHMRETIGDAHIILLTRDPLKRLLSSLKLRVDALGVDLQSMGRGDAEQQLLRFLEQNPGWIERQKAFNDYAGAAERFSREFPNLLTLGYEKLVDEREGRRQLEQFLDVAFDAAAYQRVLGQRHNAHHRALPESSVVVDRMRVLFQLQ
jgi:hypothetical protein